MNVYVYVHVCICMCMYVYVYLHMYVCMRYVRSTSGMEVRSSQQAKCWKTATYNGRFTQLHACVCMYNMYVCVCTTAAWRRCSRASGERAAGWGPVRARTACFR